MQLYKVHVFRKMKAYCLKTHKNHFMYIAHWILHIITVSAKVFIVFF